LYADRRAPNKALSDYEAAKGRGRHRDTSATVG